MSIEKEVEILRQIPLFANIDPPKLKLMAFTSERLTFKSGTTFEQCVKATRRVRCERSGSRSSG